MSTIRTPRRFVAFAAVAVSAFLPVSASLADDASTPSPAAQAAASAAQAAPTSAENVPFSPSAADVARVRQRVQSDPAFASRSAQEKENLVRLLLQGTSAPARTNDGRSLALVAPQVQGYGKTDADAAAKTKLYATVDGASDPSNLAARAEFADGYWKFTVRLHNVGSRSQYVGFSGFTLLKLGGEGGKWANPRLRTSFSVDGRAVYGVRVPAHGERTVTVSVSDPSYSLYEYVLRGGSKTAPLGGFVNFRPAEDKTAPTVSVPFTGIFKAL